MAASPFHFISTEVENHIFKHIFSLDTILLYVFINNPHYWQSSEATAGTYFVLTIYHCHNLCTYISLYKRYYFSYRCYACFGYNSSDLVSSRLVSLSHHIFAGSCNCNLKEKINMHTRHIKDQTQNNEHVFSIYWAAWIATAEVWYLFAAFFHINLILTRPFKSLFWPGLLKIKFRHNRKSKEIVLEIFKSYGTISSEVIF